MTKTPERCPDSATCNATPVRGKCPFHGDHVFDAESYGDAELLVAAIQPFEPVPFRPGRPVFDPLGPEPF